MHTNTPYRDRTHAGEVLAQHVKRALTLAELANETLMVLALPRGGVPVAEAIAKELRAPLDVIVVRKLGVPKQREIAMGALASTGDSVVHIEHTDYVREILNHGTSQDELDRVESVELAELRRRQAHYRPGMDDQDFTGITVIIVDDGLATGATMLAAIAAAKQAGAERVVVAVPVALGSVGERIAQAADEVVCPWPDADLPALGLAYEQFAQVEDSEVMNILEAERREE